MTKLKVPAFLALMIVAGVGVTAGLGGYTFHHARGFSYFSEDPAACVNCHVMRDQFEEWNHSSHRNWASCNDCHTPKGVANKYFTKALNGWNHSVKFTTMNFPEPIQIGERNRSIALSRCLDCHSTVVSHMGMSIDDAEGVRCVACHGNPGHQTRR